MSVKSPYSLHSVMMPLNFYDILLYVTMKMAERLTAVGPYSACDRNNCYVSLLVALQISFVVRCV